MKQQRGVALLTILIMVVLATLLAVSILRQQNALLDDTRVLMQQDQTVLYGQAAEDFASALLQQDRSANPTDSTDIDSLMDMWAQPLPPLPIEGGFIQVAIEDENGKFNLNSLIDDNDNVNPAAKTVFQHLLQHFNLDPQLVDAVIDWQDANQQTTGAMGAEDDFYRSSNGQLAANQPFADAAQLQQVRGFDAASYHLLEPYITALPQRDSKININTAPAVLLSCLADDLDTTAIAKLQSSMRMSMQDWSSVDKIWSLAPFSTVDETVKNRISPLLTVKSDFFVVNSDISFNDRQRYLHSRLYRSADKVQVYMRSWTLHAASK